MTQTPSRKLRLRETLTEALWRAPEILTGAAGAIGAAAAMCLLIVLAPSSGWVRILELVILGLLLLVTLGAVTRLGVAGDKAGAKALGLGPAGLQVTGTEARLLGASLLCGLFLVIMYALLGLTALALFGAAGLDAEAIRLRDWAAAGPVWKLALLAVVGVILLGAPVLLSLRLSLYAQATVATGRMISLTATRLTNGALLPLLAGLILVQAPAILWMLLAVAGVLPVSAALVGGIVLVALVQIPLQAAFLGAAYRRLEGPNDDLAPL
jgi:hypothetical protein